MKWFQATYLFLLEQVSWKESPKLRWRFSSARMAGNVRILFLRLKNQNPEDVNLMTVNVPQQDCMVRQNFVPREAQRLQHGSIRVLKDLTGYHIKGLLGGNSFRQDVTKKGSFSEKLGKRSQQKNDWKLSQQKRLTGETFPTKTMDLKGPETLSFFQDTARFGEGLRQQRRFLPASRIAKPQRFLLVDALPCKDGGLLHHSLYR